MAWNDISHRKEKGSNKDKIGRRGTYGENLVNPSTPFLIKAKWGLIWRDFLVKKPRPNEPQSNDFNKTNWSLHKKKGVLLIVDTNSSNYHPWDCCSTDKKTQAKLVRTCPGLSHYCIWTRQNLEEKCIVQCLC